jgi:hypothetical protein
VNLEPELKQVVDAEGLNLSKFVNDRLEDYFSVATVEDITREITLSKARTATLEQKRADMIAKGIATTADSGMKDIIEKELQELYRTRRENKVKEIHDRDWITSPKNLIRLRGMGWQADQALFKLKEWYDGVQKHNDS